MKEFFQTFTLNEGLTITIAILALAISVISYFNTSNRDKRQLRIGRIEEIIEIIHVLIGNYRYFDDTFFLQEKIRKGIEIESKKIELINLEKRQVDLLQNISNEINLQEKLIRMTVIVNAYLPENKLRNKLRTLVTLYTSLAEATLNRKYDDTKVIFSVYPRPWIILPFIEEIQTELIKEMKLGYDNNIYGENPFDEEFKKKMNLL
ncbi:hypothetical protein ACI6PS_05810 [Flavobacterium sp. PLA-1-15]|uniref:hypothetical protein n=1 Tax=Flavobacterium sp. PLA-1-15 TaxID=3380533 RepID=UPI003B79A127